MNSGGQPTASNTARLLATQSAQSGDIVLCDTTGQVEKEIKKNFKRRLFLSCYNISDNLSAITVPLAARFTSRLNTALKI